MKSSLHSLYLIRSLLIIALSASILTACGFQLRGSFELPVGLQKIYVSGSQSSDLLQDVKDILDFSAEVVENRADADAVLTINNEQTDNRTLSVDSRGKVRESEIQYAVIFSLVKRDGEVLLDKDSLLLVRDYINDENDIIGRTNESAVIIRELKRDAAQQIIRRVQALKVN
jgi:LPS-assembly lipoprotein